jgi:hypothetical protein
MLSRGRIVTEEVEESEEAELPVFSLGLVLPEEKVGVPVEVEEGHGVVLLCRCYNQKPETMMKLMRDLLWKTMAMIPEVLLLTG